MIAVVLAVTQQSWIVERTGNHRHRRAAERCCPGSICRGASSYNHGGTPTRYRRRGHTGAAGTQKSGCCHCRPSCRAMAPATGFQARRTRLERRSRRQCDVYPVRDLERASAAAPAIRRRTCMVGRLDSVGPARLLGHHCAEIVFRLRQCAELVPQRAEGQRSLQRANCQQHSWPQ